MIGNDIIDLEKASQESNWKRSNFLEKLFTESEKAMIRLSDDAEAMVWQLWSRKEAAYKAYNRKTGIRGFFPLRIICDDSCQMGNIYYGKTTIEGMTFHSQTTVGKTFIHTIAAESFELLDKIETFFESESGFKVSKDVAGLPYFIDKQTNVARPVSVSHHGQFYCKIITSM